MAYPELTSLAGGYPAGSQDALLELAERYRLRNEREILELAAIAADIAIDDIINLGLQPEVNPQLREAFRLQYPTVDLESLVGISDDSLTGYINGVKGKYFEVLVRNRLNAGETLGELRLDLGQMARLAEDEYQEDWDLEIVDQYDEIDEQIQLKATKTMAPVWKALRENPKIPVAVPDNLDSTSEEVLGTGLSFERLTNETEEQMDDLADGALENVLHHATEFAVDVIPIGSALVVVVIEGRQYLTGRATLRQAARSGGQRLARSTAYGTLGTALAATGLGAAAIPPVMGVRLAERRLTGQINLRSNLEDRTADLQFAFNRSHQEAPK